MDNRENLLQRVLSIMKLGNPIGRTQKLESLLQDGEFEEHKDLTLSVESYILWLKKEYDSAFEKVNKALAINDRLFISWNLLGILYTDNTEKKDFEKAEECYNKAIQIDKNFINAWSNLGILYYKKKDFEKAEEYYNKAIQIDKNFINAWSNLGILYYKKKDFEKAVKLYKKAKELCVIENDKFTASFYSQKINKCIKEQEIQKQYDDLVSHQEMEEKEEALSASDPLKQILKKTKFFEDTIFENQKNFEAFTREQIVKETAPVYLEVLRRWNSYTPIVADNYHTSKGGGYFLSIHGYGIAIDPGFNFIDNFKGAGHSFDEIDAVMITHAHNDHTSDIESILTLLERCNRKRKGDKNDFEANTHLEDMGKLEEYSKKKFEEIPEAIIEETWLKSSRRKIIDLFITKSVNKKFGGMLESSKRHDYQYHIIESGESKKINSSIDVEIIEAKHFDLISDQDSVGFVFNLNGMILVYTGDTGWNEKIAQNYKNLKAKFSEKKILLLAHLGGFKREENHYLKSGNTEKEYETFYPNHLGRLGLGRLIDIMQPQLCLISEFGEEMRGHRRNLVNIYQEHFGAKGKVFLPADIGLRYDFINHKITGITGIKGNECKMGWIEPKNVDTALLYKDYSLHYYDKQANIDPAELQHVLGHEFDNRL